MRFAHRWKCPSLVTTALVAATLVGAPAAQAGRAETYPGSPSAWQAFARAGTLRQTSSLPGGIILNGDLLTNLREAAAGTVGSSCALHRSKHGAVFFLESEHANIAIGDAAAATGGDPANDTFDETLFLLPATADQVFVTARLIPLIRSSGASFSRLDVQVDVGDDGSFEIDLTVSGLEAMGAVAALPATAPGGLIRVRLRERFLLETVTGQTLLALGRVVVSVRDPGATDAWTTIGPGCDGVGSAAPILEVSPGFSPVLGSLFRTRVVGVPENATVLGLIGFETANWFGIPLPFDLSPLGMTGCTLFTEVVFTMELFDDGAGQRPWQFVIPDDPLLAGLTFYQQVLATAPGANPFGALVSNAAMVEIR